MQRRWFSVQRSASQLPGPRRADQGNPADGDQFAAPFGLGTNGASALAPIDAGPLALPEKLLCSAAPERCPRGRWCQTRNLVWRKSPWVRIPPSPLESSPELRFLTTQFSPHGADEDSSPTDPTTEVAGSVPSRRRTFSSAATASKSAPMGADEDEFDPGEVSEWSKVHDWKSCVGQPTAGSNPALSAGSTEPLMPRVTFLPPTPPGPDGSNGTGESGCSGHFYF